MDFSTKSSARLNWVNWSTGTFLLLSHIYFTEFYLLTNEASKNIQSNLARPKKKKE